VATAPKAKDFAGVHQAKKTSMAINGKRMTGTIPIKAANEQPAHLWQRIKVTAMAFSRIGCKG